MAAITYKPSFKEQIYLKIKQAYREKNAEKIVYYQNAYNNSCACVDFDKFKGCWAYDSWKRDNYSKIEEVENEFKRFNFINH